MDSAEINPKIAAALLQDDCVIDIRKQGRRYAFTVTIGPFCAATGERRTREHARDDAYEALERSLQWLRSFAES